MQLVIVRHGPAESRDPHRWPDDDRRPLSRQGVRETRRAGRGLASLLGPVACLAASPAVRAERTAELLKDEIPRAPRIELWKELLPGAGARGAMDRLTQRRRTKEAVLVVGHEPLLSQLAGLSLTGDAVSVVHLGKAGAALVGFPGPVRAGGAVLEWLLTRKQLRKLGA
jgi:phosphohistidine phosphatase